MWKPQIPRVGRKSTSVSRVIPTSYPVYSTVVTIPIPIPSLPLFSSIQKSFSFTLRVQVRSHLTSQKSTYTFLSFAETPHHDYREFYAERSAAPVPLKQLPILRNLGILAMMSREGRDIGRYVSCELSTSYRTAIIRDSR